MGSGFRESRGVRVLASGVLSLFTFLSPARAQSVTATLVGTVLDQANSAVPGASVLVVHKGTNVARTVQTNDRGDYTVTNLQPGVYQLAAEHPGFKRAVVNEVELLVNQTARVDLVLQVGEVAERVEVTGLAPLVASENSSVGQVIQQGQILNLPLKGRALFELAQLAPGTVPRWPGSYVASVRPMPGVLAVPTFSAAGGRDNNNGYLVD